MVNNKILAKSLLTMGIVFFLGRALLAIAAIELLGDLLPIAIIIAIIAGIGKAYTLHKEEEDEHWCE